MMRLTWLGFVVGAIVFAVLGMWMNTQIEFPAFSNPGPVGILALIGGTTSGLVSPLLFRRARHRRAKHDGKR
jgi:membrane associated rhomboid family serine protease